MRADIAIVGAGILGCSIAWHLKLLAPAVRVIVLERHSGPATQATSQAAALLTSARTHPAVTAMIVRTYAAMEELGAELDQPLPLHRVGTVHIASSERAVVELEALARAVTAAGRRAEQPTIGDLCELVPWLDPASARSALLIPDDGFIDPYLLANAYAAAARRRGVEFHYRTEVVALRREGAGITGLVTSEGAVDAPIVVLAAGAWANRLSAPLGIGLAMAPVRSQYWLTEPHRVFPRAHPAVVIPEARAYTRPEIGALLFGLRERAPISMDPNDLPADMGGYAFANDPHGLESLEDGAPALRRYCPALDEIGLRSYVAGASTYTPDGLFLAGQASELMGLFVASGCCGSGIAASGGYGELVASLALGKRPAIAAAPFAPDRFGAVEPFDPGFRAHCAQARARKRAG